MKIRTEDPISGIIVTDTLEAMGCNKRSGPVFDRLGHSVEYYKEFPSTIVGITRTKEILKGISGNMDTSTYTIFDLMKAVIKY